jgi:ribonuclease P protein component
VAVTFVAGDSQESPKVAYAVGRRVGNAVKRNRLRRRLRAVVADLAPELRPGAYLLSASPEAVELAFGELRTAVAEAVKAVNQR